MDNTPVSKIGKISFLLTTLFATVLLHKYLTGSWTPTDSDVTFIIQNLILMIILGSYLIEDKFTKPVDVLVNSIVVLITLLSIHNPTRFTAWKINVVYALVVFIFSLVTILFSDKNMSETNWKNVIARAFYKLAIYFGKSELIFSITFILSIFSFYTSQSREFLILICFWAFLIVAKPIGIMNYFDKLFGFLKIEDDVIIGGKLMSVILPGSICFEPPKDVDVKIGKYVLLNEENKKLAIVISSFSNQEKRVVQAIVVSDLKDVDVNLAELKECGIHYVGSFAKLNRLIVNAEILLKTKRFVGTVIDNSEIAEIKFLVCTDVPLEEGFVLEAQINEEQVLYQIVNGKTQTLALMPDVKLGVINGIAQQIGVWDAKKVKFNKFGWVPPIHTPLFIVDESHEVKYKIDDHELILGFIPNTNYPIIANINTLITHHTALLGITGSGKTEMAFTLIEKMMALKAKVFCVDFTGDYIEQFKDLNPKRLAIPSAKAADLNEKLLAAETGAYGAGKEIAELEKFKTTLIPTIQVLIKKFVESEDYLGIFELSEIVNTSATIAITELYLSQIFSYAKANREKGRKFCIVLEEAHTIIPEAQTMGAQDKFSKATIGKISQIALQGRKYNVGLLVIAQRTANVTKTVLNQCNSIIVFNSHDKTGFDFLENYVGPGMISAIPNLKWLQSMVVGRGFKAGRPIIMNIPFKEKFKEPPPPPTTPTGSSAS